MFPGMTKFTFQFRRPDINSADGASWAEFYVEASDEAEACEKAANLKPNDPSLKLKPAEGKGG